MNFLTLLDYKDYKYFQKAENCFLHYMYRTNFRKYKTWQNVGNKTCIINIWYVSNASKCKILMYWPSNLYKGRNIISTYHHHSVESVFLFQTILPVFYKLGWSKLLPKTIKAICGKPSGNIRMNEEKLEAFPPRSRPREGSPRSLFLCNMTLDVLARSTMQGEKKRIKATNWGKKEVKFSLFADDTILSKGKSWASHQEISKIQKWLW